MQTRATNAKPNAIIISQCQSVPISHESWVMTSFFKVFIPFEVSVYTTSDCLLLTQFYGAISQSVRPIQCLCPRRRGEPPSSVYFGRQHFLPSWHCSAIMLSHFGPEFCLRPLLRIGSKILEVLSGFLCIGIYLKVTISLQYQLQWSLICTLRNDFF